MNKKTETPDEIPAINKRYRSRENYAKSLALALVIAAPSISTTSCSPEHRANKKQRKEIKEEIRKVNEDLKGNPEGVESIRNEMQKYYNEYVNAATYYNDHIEDLNDKYAKTLLLKTKKDALNAKKEYLKLLDKLQKETNTYFRRPDVTILDPTDLDTVNNLVLGL